MRCRERILELDAEKEAILSALFPSGISYDEDHVQVSPEDKMSKLFAKTASIDKKIAKAQADLIKAVNEIERRITPLAAEEKMVIWYWYVADKSPEEIAKVLHMSRATVYRRHDSAVKNLRHRETKR